jgi:hypothetical protein
MEKRVTFNPLQGLDPLIGGGRNASVASIAR